MAEAVVVGPGDGGAGEGVAGDLDRLGVRVAWLRPEEAEAVAEATAADHRRLLAAPVWLVAGEALATEPGGGEVLRALFRRALLPAGDDDRTILDLGGRHPGGGAVLSPARMDEALRVVDTVIGSEAGFHAAGVRPEVAAKRGLAVYVEHGGQGGRYLDGPRDLDVVPVLPPERWGPAAGDAFAAMVVAGLLVGRDPLTVLRRALTAGSLVAARWGSSDALPTEAELDAALAAVSGGMPSAHAASGLAAGGHAAGAPSDSPASQPRAAGSA